MASLPRAEGVDNTLALFREGYAFIGHRCDVFGTDLFRTRLLLRDVICLRGPEAVALFYGDVRLTRRGGVPGSTLRLLQGFGSVQTLDDEAHYRRKGAFMSLMTPAAQAELVQHYVRAWQQALMDWARQPGVTLRDVVPPVLLQAACAWVGILLPPSQLRCRTEELVAMVEQAGRFGPAHWQARWLRKRCERWATQLVNRVRRRAAPPDTPLGRLACYRNAQGQWLPARLAAVEVLNLLRPLVAVQRYVQFIAHALHLNPYWAEHFRAGNEAHLEAFVQEVRRFYPFFPFVGARVRESLPWQGHTLTRGQWLLLDLYGSNHHPAHWAQPQLFQPERFQTGVDAEKQLVPQGSGLLHAHHRCAGEPLTLALMKETVRLLCRHMHYQVPAQDLSISLRSIPAAPASGMVLAGVVPSVSA